MRSTNLDVVASVPSKVIEELNSFLKQKGGSLVMPAEYFGAQANPGYVPNPTYTVTNMDNTHLAREGLTMSGGYKKKTTKKTSTKKTTTKKTTTKKTTK